MDILSYFKFLTGLTPTKDQESFLLDIEDTSKNQIIATAGCQSGKTLCSAVGSLWWIFESGQRVNVLLISAQDSVLYLHIREIFKNHPELVKQLTSALSPYLVPLRGFEVKNGNQCFVRGSTEKQLSGIPANIVFIDEACLVPNNLILEGLNRLTGISKIILLSTPSKPNSLFVQWATDKKSGYEVHQWSSEGLSWHSPVIDKSKKKTMSPGIYAIYMLGRPPSAAERALWTSKDIDTCVVVCQPEREGGSKSTIEIGIDFAYGSTCKPAILVTEKLYSKRKILFARTWKEFRPDEMADVIKRYEIYRPLVKADSRPKEFQYKIEQFWKGKIFYIDASYEKKLMVSQLQRRIRIHSELIIPDCFTELVVELKKYHPKKRTGDDLVDALMIACYEPAIPFKISGGFYFNPKVKKKLSQ